MNTNENKKLFVSLHNSRAFCVEGLLSIGYDVPVVEYTTKENNGFFLKKPLFDKKKPLFKTLIFELKNPNIGLINYLNNAIENYPFNELRSKINVHGNIIELIHHPTELNLTVTL